MQLVCTAECCKRKTLQAINHVGKFTSMRKKTGLVLCVRLYGVFVITVKAQNLHHQGEKRNTALPESFS